MRAYKNEGRAEQKLSEDSGLEFFIPKHYIVQSYHGRKIKRLVPVIPSLVFVHASRKDLLEFKKKYNFLQFAMWKKSTGLEYIVVPSAQMDNFMKVATQYEEKISYCNPEEIDIAKGTRVRIHGGAFDGVEGIFVKVVGVRSRRLVVLLDGVLGVTAEVHPDLVEVLP